MGYRLRYVQEGQQQWQYVLADHASDLVLSQGLSPAHTYVVNVQAYNFLGGGPWSTPAFVYMEMGTEPSDFQLLLVCACWLFPGGVVVVV